MNINIHRYGVALAAILVLGIAVAIGMTTGLITGTASDQSADPVVPVSVTDSDSEYRDMLRELYESVPELTDDQIWYMKYTVSLESRDNATVQNYESDILMTARRMQLISNEMEVYQDEESSVTVLPGEKTIYLADRNAGEDARGWMDMFTALRDTLAFSYCYVRQCKDIQAPDGAKIKQITLALKPEYARRAGKRYPIESFVVAFNPQTHRLYSYTTHFAEPYVLRSVNLTFHEIDYRHHTDKLSRHAGDKYLAANGKVRSDYNSYTLIDVRSKR